MTMTSLSEAIQASAPSTDRRVRTGDRPAALIFNPQAGAKLGITTNQSDPEAAQAALQLAGVPFDARPTEREGHAIELAQQAVAEGRRLVIAAGGDGTVGEVAQALVGSDAILGVMPLGSVMNIARTLHVPRDLEAAAQVIAAGQVVEMDVGRVGDGYFLEAAGVGLDAALFRAFERLDRGAPKLAVARAAWRFVRALGLPRLTIRADEWRRDVRAPMVTVANSPFVGAAYAIAPEARIDDGRLDVVIFHRLSVVHLLVYLLLVAGGRPFPRPRGVERLRVRSITVEARRRRGLPVHADGALVGVTPVRFEVVPHALKVLVGTPEEGQQPPWEVLADTPATRAA
jgi:YegS/Rv2252/BmrU family lipid kinase